MNGVLHQGFWRKLPPTLLRQYTPVQTTDPYQYYYTFPSISNYDYPNNYGIEGKGGKRKKVKKKENKKKRMPIGVTIRYIPPPLTINQMVSYGKFLYRYHLEEDCIWKIGLFVGIIHIVCSHLLLSFGRISIIRFCFLTLNYY